MSVVRQQVLSETQRQSLMHQLALLDFNLTPIQVIREELKISPSLIRAYRQMKEYREALEEVREAWTEKMMQTPATNQLRKEISWAMSVAVKKVLEILTSPKSNNKDLIAAARLTALLDGRFLSSTSEQKADQMEEGVATELKQAIDRVRGTVQ